MSNYFQKEYEKIRTDDANTLGARIEFLKKILAEVCTQMYITKSAKNGKKKYFVIR